MAKRSDRGSRESRLAEGWTVEEGPGAQSQTRSDREADPAGRVLRADTGPETAASVGSGDLADTPPVGAVLAEARPQLSNGALVLLGSIGGVYLLYTLVWFSWANYYSTVNSAVADGSGVLGSVMQQVVFWLAPFAPTLWFCTVLVLNRGARLGRIVLWLLVGAVLLVPLPMFDFGAAG